VTHSTPLGATWDGRGVRFGLASRHATAAQVCLYAADDPAREEARIALELDGAGRWTAFAAGLQPGALYGFRVDGPRDAAAGHRFDPSKLLIDPRARAVAGSVRWNEALLSSSAEDSAPWVPRCVVDDGRFDWGDDAPPATSWADTVIYECHVRGMTRRHPEVPPALRGTYLGLAAPPVLEHLASLGVTALELMPVQQFAAERHLAERGLPNYWGYSPLAFFAPHSAYATGDRGEQVREFKAMVRALHGAGIEVLLDVVFNHTVEGGAGGPTLGLRGIDNATYYRTDPDDPSRYVDLTGCGNTLDCSAPAVRRLILDCLHYWVEEMHVDGFRFDLATTLGRGEAGFSPAAPLFEAIAASPVLSRVKLVAEPWDLGPGGHQAGGFPEGWREWNDRYRDAVRRFWRGDGGLAAELATRLTGSSDRYAARRSGASTGVNYVACHDGLTLEDLVTYESKRNAANLEGNRDGADDDLGANWGVEGPTRDPAVLFARQRAKKNLLATLALSAGVPMLSHGDEMARTQRGNNNAYCQDSSLSWVDWRLDARAAELLAFTRRVFRLRRGLAQTRRGRFPTADEVRWLGAGGEDLDAAAWRENGRRQFQMLAAGAAGEACGGILALFNAAPGAAPFTLPETDCGHPWVERLATAPSRPGATARGALELAAYSLAVLSCAADAAASAAERPPA